MMQEKGMVKYYWAKVTHTTNYMLNRSPSISLDIMSVGMEKSLMLIILRYLEV